MKVDSLPFQDTGFFSKIVADYLDGKEELQPFYHLPPTLNSFEKVISERNFQAQSRKILVQQLQGQYEMAGIKLSKFPAVQESIQQINQQNTFTVTTGHQLCLFTGPLYFIYKIVSAIRLTKTLGERFPNYNFVPVYWMASEDHDFDEISFFNFNGRKFKWNTEQRGAVGRMHTKELATIAKELRKELTEFSSNAERLIQLFENAYLNQENLANATRFIVNELFSEHGVVTVDGDDRELKRLFIPHCENELKTEFSSHAVENQSKKLAENYKIQVNPREINLFYLEDGSRKRLVHQDGYFKLADGEKKFSEEEILNELRLAPEKFSPNVLLRPLYQETILPNLAYIGGGGELAYWFQLNGMFKEVGIPFPLLMLRNSALWLDEKAKKYLDDLAISLKDLFLPQGELNKKWVIENSTSDLQLQTELAQRREVMNQLAEKVKAVDPSLEAHVEALARKQEKDLEQLAEKLIRSERKREVVVADKIQYLKTTLFANNGLQERTVNFSELYLVLGEKMISELLDTFDQPSEEGFKVLWQ